MRKKINYLLMIFTLFMFIGNVDAYTCEYGWNENRNQEKDNDKTYVEFEIENYKVEKLVLPHPSGKESNLSPRGISNWSKAIENVSGVRSAYLGSCPSELIVFQYEGEWQYFASNEKNNQNLRNYIYNKYGENKVKKYKRMVLLEGPRALENKEINLNFINTFKTEEVESTTQKITFQDVLDGKTFSNKSFNINGYIFSNWKIEIQYGFETYSYGTINDNKGIYEIFKKINEKNFDITQISTINLYAKWLPEKDLTIKEINDLNLGETTCKTNYVWNEKEINGIIYKYCNVDNLTYVACGDTKDIPSEVPRLISFAVNFLKIVAPLILIFIGIMSLVKAMSSSNEDEMKKAQKSLTRKLIPAVLIFFVISIVQFVIGLVADDEIKSEYNNLTEAGNLSNCLDCFLNNNCENNIYYRANIGGEYHYYSVISGKEFDFDNKYYVSTDFYQGTKNTDCESNGYFDSYHPKAVNVNGVCYDLTETGKKLINYTKTLDGIKKQVQQDIYIVQGGSCYYWEGRVNDYIEISCDTEIVNDYYRGTKQQTCDDLSSKNDYFYYGEKEGYQPRKIYDPADSKCYYLMESGFKYTNITHTLLGESLTLSQNVWRAGESCFYWSDLENQYKQIECRDYN